MQIISRRQSAYFIKRNPYFWTRARYGRPEDYLFLFILETKTGRWAKRTGRVTFPGDKGTPAPDTVRNHVERLAARLDYSRGRTLAEVVQYSGQYDFSGQDFDAPAANLN